MKTILRRILGVTLLEVMLVLAIAAMIIVMSIRYYQSASASQQANTLISQLQAIVAAAESTSAGGSVSNTKVTKLLGADAMIPPWGGTLAVKTGSTTSNLIITSSKPSENICNIIDAKISAAGTFAVNTDCTEFTYPKPST